MTTFKTTLQNFDNNLWGHHIVVPSEIKEKFVVDKDRRVIITINDSKEIPCAIMPQGEDYSFINVNKEIRKKLRIKVGDKVTVKIKKDESKYGMPMPEEFAEILYLDPEVEKYFQKLTPGKQRSLLYQIGKPKGQETRIKKAIVISEHLKTHKGNLDYKILNEEYKNYNF